MVPDPTLNLDKLQVFPYIKSENNVQKIEQLYEKNFRKLSNFYYFYYFISTARKKSTGSSARFYNF